MNDMLLHNVRLLVINENCEKNRRDKWWPPNEYKKKIKKYDSI